MIYDKIENLGKYPSLTKVKKFLDEQNGTILNNGKYEIDESCYVAVSEYETGVGKDFEAHREYIDVQIVLSGREHIFVQNIQKGTLRRNMRNKRILSFTKQAMPRRMC